MRNFWEISEGQRWTEQREGNQEFFMRVKIVVDELQMKREQELCLGYGDMTDK